MTDRRRYEARRLPPRIGGRPADDGLWGLWIVEPDGRERCVAVGDEAQCRGLAERAQAREDARPDDPERARG